MLICDVEFQLIKINPASGGIPERLVLVRVQTDEGMDGWGEAQLPWRLGELRERRDMILPLVAGKNVLDLAELSRLEQLSPKLRAALEMACRDAAGKILGQPLCCFLGGTYRTRIPTAHYVGDTDDPDLIDRGQRWLDKGIANWVVGTCGNLEDDLFALRRIRERLGTGVRIRFDARSHFSYDEALRFCSGIQALGLDMVIDFLKTKSLDSYQRLAWEMDCPLAIRLHDPEELWGTVKSQSVHHLILDMTEFGGVLSVRDAIAVATAAGIGVSLTVSTSLGLTVASMLHVGAATPSLVSAHEIVCEETLHLAIQSGLKMKDGLWEVPNAPGLGIEVSREILEQETWSHDLWDFPE